MGSKLAKLSAFILFVIGATLLAVGCAVRWKIFPDMLQSQIEENLELKEGTETYDAFITPPIPIYMQFTFFNVENPEDVALHGAKPKLVEVGPYVYSEKRHKENVTEGGADTLYYNERRTYVFDPEESTKMGCCKHTSSKSKMAAQKLKATSAATSAATTMGPTSDPVTATDPTTTEPKGCTPCSKDDKVTVLSPIWTLVNYGIDQIPRDINVVIPGAPLPITWPIIELLYGMVIAPLYDLEGGDGIFLETAVDDFLFQGVETKLTNTVWNVLENGEINIGGQTIKLPINGTAIIEMINTNVPQFADGKFGLQKGKNDTVQDMFFRINNGANDLDEFMKILEWNGDASLKENWWQNIARTPSQTDEGGKGICHDIKGTDGTLFAPSVPTDKDLWVFVPELCRSIWLEYHDDVTVTGIPAAQFRPGPKVFDMSNPDNFCYCPKFEECAAVNKTTDSYDNGPCKDQKYNCLDGLIQVGACLGPSVNGTSLPLPIAMSSPMFYRGDPMLRELFEDLPEADPEKHDTILNLDTITGLTVSAHKRIQINMPLKEITDCCGDQGDQFQHLNRSYPAFPMMWVDERAEIDQTNADKWQSEVGKAFRLVNGLTYSFGLALGAVCVVLSWFLVFFCVRK